MTFFQTLILLLSLLQLSHAAELPLSPEQVQTLESGELVVVETPQEDSPWPLVQAYKLLKSDPETAMGIFAAYDYQKEYVPNMLTSNPVLQSSPTEVQVEYRLKMPWPLNPVRYLHDHRLSRKDEVYRLDWWMIQSTSAEALKGFTEFHPYKSDSRVLMIYESSITPKSSFAKLFKGVMISDVRQSLTAITEEIEKRSLKKDDELGLKYRQILQSSLDGKKTWVQN